MRLLSPLLSIPAGVNQPSNGIEIGHHKIVGLIIYNTDAAITTITIQENINPQGNLGDTPPGDPLWASVLNVPEAGGSGVPFGIAATANDNTAYQFSRSYDRTLSLVRLLAAGTSVEIITARLVLEPHN